MLRGLMAAGETASGTGTQGLVLALAALAGSLGTLVAAGTALYKAMKRPDDDEPEKAPPPPAPDGRSHDEHEQEEQDDLLSQLVAHREAHGPSAELDRVIADLYAARGKRRGSGDADS